ncbi:MAG: hypothetical protein ACREFQ_22905 [Stellaceae bacterium]
MPTKRDRSVEAAPVAAVDTVIDHQVAFLDEMDRLSQSWLKRRTEGWEQVRRIASTMRADSDPSAIFTAQQNWISGALTRMMSDFGDLNSFALNCMSRGGQSMLAVTGTARDAAYEGLARAGAKPRAAEPQDQDQEGLTAPAATD